jgi:GNAT superfamily N-acetyltransferase
MSEPIIFRPAVLADVPAMSTIRLAVRENTLSDPGRITRQMYIDYLERSGRGWVAEINGAVVGFSCADRQDASIWALFLAEEYEGRGIGKRLLRLAVAWLFEQGHASVHLTTTPDTRADRFYHAQGWTRTPISEREAGFRIFKDTFQG